MVPRGPATWVPYSQPVRPDQLFPDGTTHPRGFPYPTRTNGPGRSSRILFRPAGKSSKVNQGLWTILTELPKDQLPMLPSPDFPTFETGLQPKSQAAHQPIPHRQFQKRSPMQIHAKMFPKNAEKPLFGEACGFQVPSSLKSGDFFAETFPARRQVPVKSPAQSA